MKTFMLYYIHCQVLPGAKKFLGYNHNQTNKQQKYCIHLFFSCTTIINKCFIVINLFFYPGINKMQTTSFF
jgi:hypothetical protein